MKQAIILSGGEGTRAIPKIGDKPKALIMIGDKPLLYHQIMLLEKFKYDEVLILTHHYYDQINDYLSIIPDQNLSIKIIKEGKPRGTAGAVINSLKHIDDQFLVIYGDTMLDVNLDKFNYFHNQDKTTDISIFIHPNDHPHDSDLIEIDEKNNIKVFHKYPHESGKFYSNLVNAALYIINKKSLEAWMKSNEKLDFVRDIFPVLLSNGTQIRGYNSPEYIKDCGTPGRIDKVNLHYDQGYIKNCSIELKQPCIFLDRDGVINEEIGHLNNCEEFKLLPGIGEAIRKINHSKYRVIIITNQPVIARGDCTLDELKQIHNKMETLLGKEGAYIDRIYFCPHHPDSGFEGEIESLKIDCDCRKPKIGLVEKAEAEFNIDLNKSWFVGDSSTDVMTARNAGIPSVLVETGYAGLDDSYSHSPDYSLPNLMSATNFILNYDDLRKLCYQKTQNIKPGDFLFIGGLSRVGKSNFSNAINFNLASRNLDSAVISLDRWLLNEDDRGKTVIGRYEIIEIKNVISKLLNRSEDIFLDCPIYHKLSKKRHLSKETIHIKKDAIIIVEGTISLILSEMVPSNRKIAISLELQENYRIERFFNEYRRRGYHDDQIKELYSERDQDEHSIIRESLKNADIHISL